MMFPNLLLISLAVTSTPTAQSGNEQPATGLFIEARLSSLNLPGINDGAIGGPAPASIGYRGDGYTFGVAPAFHRLAISTTTCQATTTVGPCNSTDSDEESVTILGLQLLGTYTFATVAEGLGEAYALGGLLFGTAFPSGVDDGDEEEMGNGIAYGVTAGAGIRYFLTAHLALGAEIGEGYVNIPLDSTETRSTRSNAFTTWGALAAQLVF